MIFWLLSLLLSRSLFLWLFSPCLAVLASLTLLVVVVVFFFSLSRPILFFQSSRTLRCCARCCRCGRCCILSVPFFCHVSTSVPSHPIDRCFPWSLFLFPKSHTHTHTHTYIHIQPKYFTPFWSPTFSLHFTRSYRTKRREHRSRTTPNHNGRVPRVGPTFRFMETRSFEPNILSFGRVLEVPCVCCVYCVGAILVTFGLTVSIE